MLLSQIEGPILIRFLRCACVLLAVIVTVTALDAAQSNPDRDALRQPMKFVDLSYPPEALAARARGFVVLELQLDGQGRVSSTDALRGEPLLAAAAAANATDWVFSPQVSGRTILVYRFDIDRGRCNEDTRSLFRLRSRTLATVTACTASGRAAVSPWPADDLQVTDRPGFVYPQIAQSARIHGTVVIRVSIAGDGTVTVATPLVGVPLLTEAALANAKAWKFATRLRSTILVYDFVFTDGFSTAGTCEGVNMNEVPFPGFIEISASAPCIEVSTGGSSAVRQR